MGAAKLTVATVIDWIISDFEAAWQGTHAIKKLDEKKPKVGWGNYHFALLATILLEVACRFCKQHGNKKYFRPLVLELKKKDPRYFKKLPGDCKELKKEEYSLPSIGSYPDRQIIAVIFDLVRNGHSHGYESYVARLSSRVKQTLTIGLTGASSNKTLREPQKTIRKKNHLCLMTPAKDEYVVRVRTDYLFMDIKDAVTKSGIRDSKIEYRTKQRKRSYKFTGKQLEGFFGKFSNE